MEKSCSEKQYKCLLWAYGPRVHIGKHRNHKIHWDWAPAVNNSVDEGKGNKANEGTAALWRICSSVVIVCSKGAVRWNEEMKMKGNGCCFEGQWVHGKGFCFMFSLFSKRRRFKGYKRKKIRTKRRRFESFRDLTENLTRGKHHFPLGKCQRLHVNIDIVLNFKLWSFGYPFP